MMCSARRPRRTRALLVGALLLCAVGGVHAQVLGLESELILSTDHQSQPTFEGRSLARSGNVVAVGAAPGGSRGMVMVYEKQEDGTHRLLEKILPPAAFPQASFGEAVSLWEDRLAVGIPTTPNGGAVAMYRRSGDHWVEELVVERPFDSNSFEFGKAVLLLEDELYVGAPDGSGVVIHFKWIEDRWVEQQRFTGTANTEFGAAFDVQGNTMVIGAQDAGGVQSRSGRAYVYHRSESGWGWRQDLFDPNGSANAALGTSIRVQDDYIYLGAPRQAQQGRSVGRVAIFKRSGENWSYLGRVEAPDGSTGRDFGISIDSDRSRLLVGNARSVNAFPGNGAAYMYDRSGDEWTGRFIYYNQLRDFPDDTMGSKVLLYGTKVLVSAPTRHETGSNSGGTVVFGEWGPLGVAEEVLVAKVHGSTDRMGKATAAADGLMVVGVPYDDVEFGNSGSVRVYRYDGSEWLLEAQLTPSTPGRHAEFGSSVATDGLTVVVGAPQEDGADRQEGAAYVFRQVGGSWTQVARLKSPQPIPFDRFGFAVSLQRDAIAIGAPEDDRVNFNGGAVYLYREQNRNWNLSQIVTAPAAGEKSEFGYAMVMEGEKMLVGAPGDSEAFTGSGAGYIYVLQDGEWVLDSKLVSPDARSNDRAGMQVGLDGSLAVLGAPSSSRQRTNGGVLFTFEEDSEGWRGTDLLTPPTAVAELQFSMAVALKENLLIVGQERKVQPYPHAHVYRRDGASWSLLGQLSSAIDPSGTPWRSRTDSLTIMDGRVIAGRSTLQTFTTQSGAVQTYRLFTEEGPDNLRVTERTMDSISIAWDDNSENEFGFRVYGHAGRGRPRTLLAELGPDETEFTLSGLSPLEIWTIQVCAFNDLVESARTPLTVLRTIGPDGYDFGSGIMVR